MEFTWCPGCGNYFILAALKKALADFGKDPAKVIICGDIGCGAKMPYHVDGYKFFIGLHGRVIPLAVGMKLADPELTVIAIGGDGGIYGEGINHLIHTARRNINIVTLVSNNSIYALTTGQPSSTTQIGLKTKVSPCGVIDTPLDPVSLVKSAGGKYVEHLRENDPKLSETILNALRYEGFSLIDIKSKCVTFNPEN